MLARKAKKRARDSDHDSAEDERSEVASITFPQFSGEFSSWDAFHEELTRYQEETHQLYKTRSTNSVADRNKQRTTAATRRGTPAVLFDESLGFYTKTLICTHGWTFKPRGKGSRTNHNIRSIDCPAKLSAVLVQSRDGSYKVRVSKHIAIHNHDVDRDVYYSYAEARKKPSPGTRGVVKTPAQGGSKKKKILRYLKEVSGKPVLPRDVENLVAKMRKETYTSEDDNERAAQVLRDFCKSPGNAVNVFRDKEMGFTSCITFQTAHMRRMTRKFPEAICVDATYGTNINRYRLFSFMITDKFGCGSFAQHALVDGQSQLNMLCAILCQKIAEVVADKGSRNVRALLDFLTQLEGVARHNDMPPSYRDISNGVEVTNSDGVGEQITNVGEPIPADEDVTNSNDAGDNVTNSYDAGMDDTNSGSVLTPDSTPEIKIEKGARVELTSTPASARRKLDLDSVGNASTDEESVNIVLNTASRPAGRPREKKAVKKAKRRKEFDDTKTLVQQINTQGDITLSDLREYMERKKLSLEKVEPVFNAIRPRHDDALFKRPKGHVLRRGQQQLSRQIPDSFFQSFSSRKLNQGDGMLSYAGSPTTDERHRMKTSPYQS
ncbi:hypothetical protein PI125_g18348 [Phytophthora idaei]|nr:hypothetical protein PI125_g18348 [Phytophthora idaei]